MTRSSALAPEEPPQRPAPSATTGGRVIADRFHLDPRASALGRGTFGEVHAAVDLFDGRPVALKRIFVRRYPTVDADSNAVADQLSAVPDCVVREIESLRRCASPHVVPLLAAVVDPPRHVCLATPLAVADLSWLLGRGRRRGGQRAVVPPPPTVVLRSIALHLVRAVASVHAAGVVHRDVKPSNVLLSSTGDWWLADFGLARPAVDAAPLSSPSLSTPPPPGLPPPAGDGSAPSALSRPGSPAGMGSLWYRAPELLLGATPSSRAGDVWALGCVVGEAAAGGEPLFPGSGEIDQLRRVVESTGWWEGARRLPDHGKVMGVPVGWSARGAHVSPPPGAKTLNAALAPLGSRGAAFVRATLVSDPAARPTATDLLRHPWIAGAPDDVQAREATLRWLRGCDGRQGARE